MADAAMILAAGKGTRLLPLTAELAKPMVPVGDRPAVAHVAARVRRAASRVVVNVHHRAPDVVAWAEAEGLLVSREDRALLGTAGGVARARSLLGEGDVLVWNADILSELDPSTLALAPGMLAVLAVAPRPRYAGNVGIDEEGNVVRLRGERFGAERSGGEFLGVHLLSAELRSSLPVVGCLVGDVYLPALRRGGRLAAALTERAFVDVGTIAAYLDANSAWLAARGLASWAGPGAVVTADVEGSVVGAGARVTAPARGCVVWPNAALDSPASRAVVTPSGVVAA